MAKIPVALQLYTVRDQLSKDFVGTLRKVKEIGYDRVQLTTSMPFDAPKLREVLDDIGLVPVGIHVDGKQLQTDLQRWIDFCKTLGMDYLTWPYLGESDRKTKQDWLRMAGIMDGVGARCKKEGLRFAYHNHSFEFAKFDGQYAFDLLYASTKPDHLKAEIDTYWVLHGGEDPAAYIRKYAGRQVCLHIKDMLGDESRAFAEIGKGILDWQGIHAAAQKAGVECYVVEQDRCAGDSLESARISREFTRTLTGN
jgi:sugar phosphate isomerase/epimerase